MSRSRDLERFEADVGKVGGSGLITVVRRMRERAKVAAKEEIWAAEAFL
jgi:hypothetical protein